MNIRNIINTWRLRNKDFTVLSNNCIGGMICHDLGQRFNSPTINMWIKPQYYLEFLSNIEHYLNADWEEIIDENVNYPVAIIGGKVELRLMHYRSIQEAKDAWDRRKVRINWNNIYVIMQEGSECPYEYLKAFDKLPFKHKICLTHKPYPNISSAFVVKGFEKNRYVDVLTDLDGPCGKHKYDCVDWVKFFNQK